MSLIVAKSSWRNIRARVARLFLSAIAAFFSCWKALARRLRWISVALRRTLALWAWSSAICGYVKAPYAEGLVSESESGESEEEAIPSLSTLYDITGTVVFVTA